MAQSKPFIVWANKLKTDNIRNRRWDFKKYDWLGVTEHGSARLSIPFPSVFVGQ